MKPDQLRRLREAIRGFRTGVREFRSRSTQAKRHYSGPGYVRDQQMMKRPLNMLAMIVDAHLRFLIANAPRALVTTCYKQLRPDAYTLELGVNHLIEKIRLQDSLRKVFKDGMFGAPAMKIGLAVDTASDDFTGDPGQVFAMPVSSDCFLFDTKATRFEQCSWVADLHQLPLDWVKSDDSPYENTKNLSATERWSVAEEHFNDRARDLSFGREGPSLYDEYQDMIDLYDVWVPGEGQVVTFAVSDESGDKPLLIQDWDGPQHGPYHQFWYDDVPDNVLPKPPAFDWMDLEDAENRVLRKVIQQAERQKTVVAVMGDEITDGERMRNAGDGEMVPMNDPASVKEVRLGGIDNITMQAAVYLKGLLSWQAGNLDSIAGLGAQAETATQDKLMREAASEKLRDMQKQCYAFTKAVMTDIAWYMFSDPYLDLPLVKRVGNVEIPTRLTADSKRGEFFDYNFAVEPFSMQPKSPAERLQVVSGVMDKLIALAQLSQQEGVVPSMKKYVESVKRLTGVDEIDDLFVNTGQDPTEKQPIQPRQSPNTTRTNVRRNVSQRSPDQQMMQSLMSEGRNGTNQYSLPTPQ